MSFATTCILAQDRFKRFPEGLSESTPLPPHEANRVATQDLHQAQKPVNFTDTDLVNGDQTNRTTF